MYKQYELDAFSNEAKEFANNTLKASSHFFRLVKMMMNNLIFGLENILRLFFLKPNLRIKKAPGVFEELNSHPPPGRMF